MADFKITFKSPSSFIVKFGDASTFNTEFGEVQIVNKVGEVYEGEYEAVPKLEEQTLATAQKFMKDDIKIKQIPISVVSNTGGGNTVIIGG